MLANGDKLITDGSPWFINGAEIRILGSIVNVSIFDMPIEIEKDLFLVSLSKHAQVWNSDLVYSDLRGEQSSVSRDWTKISHGCRINVWIGELDCQSSCKHRRGPINKSAHFTSGRLPIIFNSQEYIILKNQTGYRLHR